MPLRYASLKIYLMCLIMSLWLAFGYWLLTETRNILSYIFSQTIDMLYFLLIMVIFLLAYGVAQQAILHPNEEPSWSVVSGVFFRPYFQVYGELFVETPDTSKHGLFSLTTQAIPWYNIRKLVWFLNEIMTSFSSLFCLHLTNVPNRRSRGTTLS